MTIDAPYLWHGFIRAPFSDLVACALQGGRRAEHLLERERPELFEIVTADDQAQSTMRAMRFPKDVAIVLARIHGGIAALRASSDFADAPCEELEFDVKDLIHVVDRLHVDLACIVSRALKTPTSFHKLPEQLPVGCALRRTLEETADDLRANREMRNDLEHLLKKPKEGAKDIERFPHLGALLQAALGRDTFRSEPLEAFVAQTTARAFTLAVQSEDFVRAFLVETFGKELCWNEVPATIATRDDGPGHGLMMPRRHLDALERTLRFAEANRA